MMNISERDLKYNAILGLLVSYGSRIDFTINEIDGELPKVLIGNEDDCLFGNLYTIRANGTKIEVEYEKECKEGFTEDLLESTIMPQSYGTILNAVYNATNKQYLLTCLDTLTEEESVVCGCKINAYGAIDNEWHVEYELIHSNHNIEISDSERIVKELEKDHASKFEEFEFRLKSVNM